jgi:hypothetical protein
LHQPRKLTPSGTAGSSPAPSAKIECVLDPGGWPPSHRQDEMMLEIPLDKTKQQKEAPEQYGTHFINVDRFKDYHPTLKYFFESLPKNVHPLRLLDVACGNQKRIIDGVARLNTKVELHAADHILPVDLIPTPPECF